MKLKNLIKSLALGVGLLCASVLSSQAAIASLTTTAASTNSILAGTQQVYIAEITIANNTAQPLQIALFDAPSTNLTWSAGAYTNLYTYPTNIVTVFTNFTGIVQSNTNSAVFTETRSIAASTRSYQQLVALSIAASATVTYKPIDGLTTSYGICSTNNTNCTFTITYSNIR